MAGAVPRWLSAAFVLEEGFPIAELRAIVADMAERRRGRGRADRHRRHQGGRPGRRRRPVHHHGGRRHHPARAASSRPVQPGDVVLVSGTIGDHGMAVMLARGDLALEADIRSDTAAVERAGRARSGRPPRRCACCATRPAAASARSPTSWPTRPASASCSTSRRSRSRRWSTAPATCSASTRSTSPTRARWSPSSRRRRPTPRSPRCAAHPLGAQRRRHRRDRRRARRHRRAAHRVRRHPDRRHARRRPAAPDLLGMAVSRCRTVGFARVVPMSLLGGRRRTVRGRR